MLEPLLLEDSKGLIMKLKVKYRFPTSSSGASFFIYQLLEGLEMRKILEDVVRMQKNTQTRMHIFRFSRTFTELSGFKVQLAPSYKNFSNGYANPEIIYTVPLKMLFTNTKES